MLRIAVVALLAAALAACGSQEAAPATTGQDVPAERDVATVESEAGSAVLSIPAGALPQGVTSDDIQIHEVSDDSDSFIVTEGHPPLAVYQLEPDGLQLSEPVTLTVRLQIEDPSGELIAVLVSGDEAEVITDLESEFDPENNILTASMQLTHFSKVWLAVGGMFEIEVNTSATEIPFGGEFTATLTVTRIPEPGQGGDVVYGYFFYLADTPWSVEGSLKPHGPVAPAEVEIPRRSVSTRTFTDAPRDFECAAAGGSFLTYRGAVFYQLLSTSSPDPKPLTTGDVVRGYSDLLECVMPKIVASAAPPFTTYTLSPEIPSATFFAWSGADCGSITNSNTNTMVWNHGEEDCEHAGEAHPTTEISVFVSGTLPVSGESFELRCTYRSAASGEGKKCALEQ